MSAIPRRVAVGLTILAAAAGALALLAVVAHSPFVERRALSWGFAQLGRFGIEGSGDRLEYSLAGLDVRVRNVKLSARGRADQPFFVADEVHVDFGWPIVRGDWAVEAVEVTRASLTYARRLDGTSNWPTPPPTAPGGPTPARPIGAVRVRDFSFSWHDEVNAISVDVPGASLDLTPSASGISGPLTLREPLRFGWRAQSTTARVSNGALSYDGTAVQIRELQLALPEGNVQVAGRIDRLFDERTLALDMRSTVFAEGLAPWIGLSPAPKGQFAVNATITGPPSEPRMTARVSSRQLEWAGLQNMSGAAAVTIAGSSVQFDSLAWRLAGGELSGRGRFALGASTTDNELVLDWRDLDEAALISAAAPSAGVRVRSRVAGRLAATWPADRLEQLRATLNAESAAPEGAGAAGVRGTLLANARDGAWTAAIDQWIGEAVHATGTLSGRLSVQPWSDSTLGGMVLVAADELDRARQVAGATGLLDAAGTGTLAGSAQVALTLGGTIGAPNAVGPLTASGIRYRELGPATVSADLSLSSNTLNFSAGQVRLGSDLLTVNGRVGFDNKSIDAQARWTIPDLASLTANAPPYLRPTGDLQGEGTLTGRWTDPHAQATVSGSALGLAGQQLGRWSASLRLDGRTVTVDDLAIEQNDGRISARGEYVLNTDAYAVTVSGRRIQVSPLRRGPPDEAPLPIRARIDIDFAGSGTLTDPRGQGTVAVSELAWGDWPIGAARVDVSIENRAAAFDVSSPSLFLTARANLGLRPYGRFDVDAFVRDGDLKQVLDRLPQPLEVPIAGVTTLEVKVAGDVDRLSEAAGELDLQRLDAEVGGTPLKLVAPARVTYRPDQLAADRLSLTLGRARVDVDGQIGAGTTGGLRGSLNGPLSDVVTVARAVASAYKRDLPTFDLAGDLQVDVTASGTVQRPSVDGGLSVRDGRFTWSTYPAATGISVQASYRDGTLALDRLGATWQNATISATGRLPAAMLGSYLPAAYLKTLPAGVGPARLDAHVEALTLAALAPLMNASSSAPEKIEGEVAATVALQADALSADRVRGEVRLDRADLVLAGVTISQQRPTRIAFEQGRGRIVDFDWAGAGGTIVAGGTFDLGRNAAIDLTSNGTIDLRILGGFLAGINTGGRARLAVRIGGTTNQPQLGGRIDLSGGEFRQTSPRVAVSGLAGAIMLEGNRIFSPEPLMGMANGGTLGLTVDLRLPSLSAATGEVAIDGRGMAAEVPEGLRTELDANLTLQVAEEGLALGGTVSVLRGSYRDPLSVTGGLLAALQQPTPAFTEPPTRLGSTTLDIRVFTREDIRVDNNYARLALGADLRIVGTVAQPSVLGRASPREGGQIFLGSNTYRLSADGSIDFSNPTRIEPDLNITAVTRVRNYDITLALKGTPSQLQTDLTADPPELDRTDIVAMLVTGQTLSEAAGQPLVGTEQVLGILSGEVLSTTGRAVGLDVLRVERGTPSAQFNPGLVATDANPGSRLTFGKRVTSNAEVIFSQSLRESGGLTWIVSYAPRPRIELRVVSDDQHNRTYDFRHDLSFGGPPGFGSEKRSAPEPRVRTVQFDGDLRDVDQKALNGAVKLKEGSRFDFFKWQDDRDRLAALLHRQGFLEARVEAGHGPLVNSDTPVALTYTIDRGPRTTLAVTGYSPSASTRRALEAAWTEAVFDEFLLDEMTTIVRTDLASSGYVWANAAASVQPPSNADEKRIVIQVDPGRHAAHRRIDFRGNELRSDAELDRIVEARSLASRAWVDPGALQDALAAFYRDEGLLAASVAVRPIEMIGDDAILPVEINEGPQFRIGDVAIEGSVAQPDPQVRDWLGLAVDAPYRTTAIEDARRRLETEYRKRGFTKVAIELSAARMAEGGLVRLGVRVREGPRQVLREIRVEGAERTTQTLVSRILNLDIGSPVDLSEWQEARRRLYDTGVFRRVDVQEEIVQASESGDEPVRARVAVEEWPPVRLRYGFGVTDETSTSTDVRTFRPGLSSDVTFRNVFRLAATTGGSVLYTKDHRAGRIFVTVPTIFGRPIVSNFFVSRSHESVSETGAKPFVTDKTDLTAEQRIRPVRGLEITYSYNFERNHTFELGVDPSDPLAFDLTINIARLGSTIRFDSRNDLVDATRGWFHSSSFEYAPAALGSDLPFAKYLMLQDYYRPLFGRVVVASALRLGLAKGFGQGLAPSERFFVGGGNSVRGYLQDALSPRDFLDQPVGGNALLVFNEELRFPILWRFRGVAFFDAGRAFEEPRDVSIKNLGTSVGWGLRVDTPVALIRIDFGTPLNPRANESRRSVFFSLGQAF